MTRTVERIERAGCRVEAVLGDYPAVPGTRSADVWLIRARKRARSGRARPC